LLHGFGQIVQRFNFFSVHLFHGEVGEIVVADCAIGRKYLAENNDAAISLRKKLGLKMVHVNETLRRFTLPVRSPFFEILAG
jgi:hypothetical protein